MTEQGHGPEADTRAQLVAAPDAEAQALYSNYVQATFTPYDLTLHFGWYAVPAFVGPPPAGDVDVPVTPLAKVSIPLNLVRGVADLLQRQIEAWEAAFGEPMPREPAADVEQQEAKP